MTITAEILSTGDELLRGELVNTNSAWLAGRLRELGLPLARMATIGDDLTEIANTVKKATRRCQVLLISGGLGPTDDDRTAAAVAQAAGQELYLHEEALATLKARFARAGYDFTPNNEKQAWIPRTAELVPNALGTAPGFKLQVGQCVLYCLPGVPRELKQMFHEHLAPQLQQAFQRAPAVIRRLNIFGLGESQIDQRLRDLLSTVDTGSFEVSIHYRTSFPENRVTFIAHPPQGGAQSEAQDPVPVLDRLCEEARRRLDPHVFSTGQQSFSDAVVGALGRAGATLALAESCTGGLAGDLITSAAGSSEVFHLGVVTYSNEFKQKIIKVPQEVLEQQGAVSQQCVEAMARGVRALAGATYGVAISGIAGPGGGSAEKPVGTVHFALASRDRVRHVHRVFPFDRTQVKKISAYVALELVRRELAGTLTNDDPVGGRWPSRKTR